MGISTFTSKEFVMFCRVSKIDNVYRFLMDFTIFILPMRALFGVMFVMFSLWLFNIAMEAMAHL